MAGVWTGGEVEPDYFGPNASLGSAGEDITTDGQVRIGALASQLLAIRWVEPNRLVAISLPGGTHRVTMGALLESANKDYHLISLDGRVAEKVPEQDEAVLEARLRDFSTTQSELGEQSTSAAASRALGTLLTGRDQRTQTTSGYLRSPGAEAEVEYTMTAVYSDASTVGVHLSVRNGALGYDREFTLRTNSEARSGRYGIGYDMSNTVLFSAENMSLSPDGRFVKIHNAVLDLETGAVHPLYWYNLTGKVRSAMSPDWSRVAFVWGLTNLKIAVLDFNLSTLDR